MTTEPCENCGTPVVHARELGAPGDGWWTPIGEAYVGARIGAGFVQHTAEQCRARRAAS